MLRFLINYCNMTNVIFKNMTDDYIAQVSLYFCHFPQSFANNN